MVDLVALQKRNDHWWQTTSLSGRLDRDFAKYAKIIVANKARYLDIVHRLQHLGSNMPDEAWVFVAVIHFRESTLNFETHLGQGDPLNKKTTHVPAGRGPFKGPDAFEQGAVDALWYCAPYAAKLNKDWSISGMLTYLERYNGVLYAVKGRPSPYLWSGTRAYDPPTGPGGKVVVDHGPIMPVVDKQLGVAGLLMAIDAIDDAIDFHRLPEIPSPPIATDPLGGEKTPKSGVFDAVWVQWALNKLGTHPPLDVDGVVGTLTKQAVRAFQKSHGLKVDGIAGVKTIGALKKELTKEGVPLFPAPDPATQ